MGATGWSYFVPYQEDVDKALQKLREEIFKEGQYQKPYEPSGKELETAKSLLASLSLDPQRTRKDLDALLALSEALTGPRKRRRAPKTIKQLLKQSEDSGTHSILDIERVSTTPSFGAIAPLSGQQLMEIFGTEQPTRAKVEKWSARIDPPDAEPLYRRWQGIYIIVYRDSQPDEIYFEGCSGD
jgi:hypothetical protein